MSIIAMRLEADSELTEEVETETSTPDPKSVKGVANMIQKDDKDESHVEGEEVEALSHKEMRKKRKVEKQAARDSALVAKSTIANPPIHPSRAAAVASANVVVSQSAHDKRSKFSVWIGNLSFRTSTSRLQEWFEQHGIHGISRINMPNGQKKQDHNRGFAYVDIPSAEIMQKCIDLSESHLEGRRLLIKSGSDYTGRPEIDREALKLARATNLKIELDEEKSKGKTGLTKTAQKILRAQKHSPGPTLFIGNLSFNTTETGLRDLIERSAMARYQRKIQKSKSTDGDDDDESKDESKNDVASSGEIRDDKSESKVEDQNQEDEEDELGKGAVEEETIIDEAKQSKRERTARPKVQNLRGAGVRKVRMGQFEDTGKCKGFAFVDFFTPAYATASLIDPRNFKLDGRDLLLQYAGAEAIRRGAPKGQIGGPRQIRERTFKRVHREAFEQPKVYETKEILGPAPEIGSFDPDAPLPKKHKETKEERIKRREIQAAIPNRRLKPGAALANAQRGKTGIIKDAPVGIKKMFD